MSSSAQSANEQVSLGPKPEAAAPDAARFIGRLAYYPNPVDGRACPLPSGRFYAPQLRD